MPGSLIPFRLLTRFLPLTLLLVAISLRASGQDPTPPKPAPDVLIFTNGDQLTGKLVQAVGGSITFHSEMAGDLSVSLDKVRELRSSGSFALLEKEQKVVGALVRPGSVTVKDGKLSIASGEQIIQTIPVKDVGYLIDEPTFRRETNPHPSIWYGWNGAVSAGATVVRATQNATTFNATVALVRTFPTVSYLPPRNRTLVDLSETYGTQRSPGAIPNPLGLPDQLVKTSIFHADAEQDEYLSRRFYYLGEVAFDHNFSLGLDLDQIYGAGVGYTVISDAKQQLDVKADVHYERQAFFQSTSNQDLVGSTFGETYRRTLPRKILFTEAGNFIYSWNNSDAYAANLSAGFAFPIWRRFAANVTATDNYVNNTPAFYKKSSFQFVTGVSYTLK